MNKFGCRTAFLSISLLAAGLLFAPAGIASAQKVFGPALTQANRVADNVDLNPRAQVVGHIPAWATPAADAGAVGYDTPELLTFDISRSPEVQAAFLQLLADQQNPASPRYHQWLTPQQIGEQYGPTQHDLDALTAWLTSAGFTVTSVTPSRTFVQATAPASVVSSALQTSLHTFHVASGTLQAPLTEPTLPAALAPMVTFVSGLATVQYHTFSTVLPRLPMTAVFPSTPASAAGTPAVRPNFTLSNGSVHFLAPADFNLIYDVTPTLNSGNTGTGQRVAVIGGSRLTTSDVTNWESLSSLPSYQPNYIVPSGLTDPGTTADGNQGEATLDFERVYGTAPGAQVDLVISKNALSSDTDTLQLYAINTLNDAVLTMSYGACETGYAAYAQHEDMLFSQAIAQGISVFASSGDSGVAGCEQQGAAPPASQYASIEVPCDSQYITCVGGTQFSDTANPASYWSTTNGVGELSALSYIPEGAWNEPSYTTSSGSTAYQIAASTGGPSVAIAKPVWQTGSNVPADKVRDVPDVSFSASTHNAYFSCLLYANADCSATTGNYLTGFGGTSASAPSMAGLAALLNQKVGKRLGLLNPMLYSTAVSAPQVFHDAIPATSGVSTCTTATASTCNNSDPGPSSLTGGIVGFPLQVGYDFPTGLGSLDFGKLVTSLTGGTPPGFTMSATPATVSFSAGASSGNGVTITYTAVGGFTGTLTQTCKLVPLAIAAVPIAPSCSPGSTTVSLTGASATSTVTIGSTASAVSGGVQKLSSLRTGALGGLSLAGLTLLCFPSRRRLRNWRALSMLLMLSVALFTVAGCSGSSSSSGGGGVSGTTRGSYTLTVVGSNTSQTLSTSTVITIN